MALRTLVDIGGTRLFVVELNTNSMGSAIKGGSAERIASSCVCCGASNIRSSPAILMPFIADRVFGWKPVQVDRNWGLKTISEGMAYALCNSLFCTDCDLLFLDIRFSEAEMKKLYRDYRGPEYTALREFYEEGYTTRNQELARPVVYLRSTEEFICNHISVPKSVLDWGGDTGLNTPFNKSGIRVDLYDISGKFRDDGSEVSDTRRFISQSYDLIVCCNVLEHVPFPLVTLMEIRRFMGASTFLFIEVPFEALMASADRMELPYLKRHWHEHINFFSQESLFRLAARCGFEVVCFRSIFTNETGNQSQVFQMLLCRP